MKLQMFCLAVAIATGAVSAWPLAAEARIRCEGPFQVVPGQGNLATPYCEDEYLAQVARGYGIQVSGRVIRGNPDKKEEVCRAIGHDSRVNDICIKYLNYGEDRYDN